MAVSRVQAVEQNFRRHVEECATRPRRFDLDAPVIGGTSLTARTAIRLFEHQVESRHVDFLARELKARGEGYYTIGSSGHEGNAAVAGATLPEDVSFLHYRSGAYFLTRAGQVPGTTGALDIFLGMVASRDEPIAGGRHKVFGSLDLAMPPQTSTIASHLPKALGFAVAIDRRARLMEQPDDRIAICTFGDASANHSTAVGALNSAAWATYQRVAAPVLFVCEDNGTGISVRTPDGWVQFAHQHRAGVKYFFGDGLSLPSAWNAARAAADYVRTERKPAFLHLRTIRLLGHAGSDVEQSYRDLEEVERIEAMDPLRVTASLLIDEGWMSGEEVMALYDGTASRLSALAEEAVRRPKLTTRVEVMSALASHDAEAVRSACRVAPEDRRREVFGGRLPEEESRPRHLAVQLNRALTDVLAAHDEALIFGEDVAKKGGVYHVTHGLSSTFGVGRVFNTLLDEQTILGLAIGAGHAEMLPLPEIQYLAYLMNAIDQLRGEAGSMQFFSQGAFSNPMVVRVAGLAYQKGFGGHFHNDNGIAALREIPGLLVGCPSHGGDGVRMLRTMVGAAAAMGRVTVLLEPIALYMMKDLHEEGDGEWLRAYPPPDESLVVGEVEAHGEGTDLCIATYANGLWMSLRVAKRLETRGIQCRVIDLRWLQPLPIDHLMPHAEACGRLLVVDECRASSGIADAVASEVAERSSGSVRCSRLSAPDTYIPLGDAANLVLVTEADIEAAILQALEDQ